MEINAAFPSGIPSLDPNQTLHPLNLPEVCHLIAQYLSSFDLLACILVSRTFHTNFTPSLWSAFFFDRTFAQPSNKPAFRKHEHLIRNLVVRDYEAFLLDNNISYSNVNDIFNNNDSDSSSGSMGGVWYTDHCTNLRCLEILPESVTCNSRIRRQWMTLQNFREDDDHSDPTGVSNPSMATASSTTTTSVSWTQQLTERTVDQFMDLVAQQRNLTTLKENWSMISSAYTTRFITRICHFSNKLVVLHLSKWHVSVQDLNDLISHSPCLLELTVRGLYITPSGASAAASAATSTSISTSMSNETGKQHDSQEQQHPILNFRQIRRLRFHLLVLRVSPLRMECPAAQSLELSGYGNYYASALDIFTRRGHSWNCPRLQTLQYTGQVHEAEALYEYSEQGALSHILKSCVSLPHNSTGPVTSSTTNPSSSSSSSSSSTTATAITTTHDDRDQSLNYRGLKRIALNCCFGLGMGQGQHGGLWQRALDLHWATLESIDLSYSKGIDSDVIHAIFSTCPRLKRFRGSEDTFAGTTLQNSNRVPWKCLNLERLQVRFVLETSDVFDRIDSSSSVQSKGQQQAGLLYDQLAVLTHLKVLDLSGYGSVDDTQRGIPLTLNGGLDRLRGLTAMETVHVTGWQDQMDIAEAEWMAKHWPKLTNIYSLRNKDMKQWELFLQCLKHAQERVREREHL